MRTNTKTFVAAAGLAVILAAPKPVMAGHRHHYGHHHGATWGAALGGTALGFLMGNAAAQANKPAQPQVVVLQPPPAPQVRDASYVQSTEMERLRQRNLRLEWELELMRARQARGNGLVGNAGE